METQTRSVRDQVLSGARWALILNVATMPLAILTSMALGNVSPEVLGQYGAVDLYVRLFQVFFVIGKRGVDLRGEHFLEINNAFITSFSGRIQIRIVLDAEKRN